MTDKTTFIVTRSPSSAWDEELPMREQVGWDDHAHFMDDLTASGFIYIGGPLTDSREFLFVIEAEDEGEVRRIFTRDPWEAADILTHDRFAHGLCCWIRVRTLIKGRNAPDLSKSSC